MNGIPYLVTLISLLGWLLLPAGLVPARTAELGQDTAFIKIHHRRAEELLPHVRALLSDTGRVSADTLTNSLIVVDRPEQIDRIKDLARTLDRPAPQVTVLLRFNNSQNRSGRLLSTSRGIEGGRAGLRLGTGKTNRQQTLAITLSSGTEGFLVVGRQVPVTRAWIDLCRRYGFRAGWLTGYKTLASGLAVRPVVLDQKVQLTLTPRLSFARGRSLAFTEAAATVLLTPDTWTPLATATGQQDILEAVIVSGATSHQDRAMILEVQVRIH